MTKISTTILKDCSDAFNLARKSIYEGTALLYRIEQEKLYTGHFESFSAYVEGECQLSKGYASKLLTAYRFYCIDRGVSHDKLDGIDPEKLYLSTKLPQETLTSVRSPEDLLVYAREWSREDFRDELHSKMGVDCRHPEDKRIVLCGVCNKRVG